MLSRILACTFMTFSALSSMIPFNNHLVMSSIFASWSVFWGILAVIDLLDKENGV